jgi:hypothetical protein
MITEIPAAVPAVVPKTGRHDPSWLIQRAWGVFRLPRLQELIVSTIDELRIEPCSTVAETHEQSGRPAGPDPAAEAFRACCDELREASGMPGADEVRARHVAVIRRYMREEPSDWTEAFSQALDAYRQAAAQAVERAFSRAGTA